MESPEFSRRLGRGERSQFAPLAMKSNQFGDVHIRQPVAIGEAESLFVRHIRQNPLKPAACHRIDSCIDQSDPPRFTSVTMELHLVLFQIHRHIGGIEKIVGEILFYDDALIPQADDKVVDAMRRINIHDMPENRALTHLHHRLRSQYGLFAEPAAQPSCEDNCFHRPSSGSTQPKKKSGSGTLWIHSALAQCICKLLFLWYMPREARDF